MLTVMFAECLGMEPIYCLYRGSTREWISFKSLFESLDCVS